MGKRGPYKKRKKRKYRSGAKTTTLAGKREYMRNFMRVKLGVAPARYGKRGPKPHRILVKDCLTELIQLKQSRRR